MRLGLLGTLLSLVAVPLGAAFSVNDEGWEGTSELLEVARTKLGRERVQVVATLDFGELGPADGILVLAPRVPLDYAELSAFLRAGGRLAVLDDYGTGSKLLERFQIQRIQAPLRPARVLRQNSQLAIAVPAVQQVAGHEQGRHPVVADVDQLVTNHPTALTHPNLTPVLKIPAIGEPDAALAVTGIIVDRGRLFAMGDPSAVINLMLRYPGNRAFASGLVSYLVEADSWSPRGGKLYLLSGEFRQQGHYGGESGFADELREQFAGLLETFEEVRQGGLPGSFAVLLGAFLALASGVWTARVATRPYRRANPRYATAVPLVGQGGVAGRAAVLAAPTTHRALALLELKSALEEALMDKLGLARGASQTALLAEIDRQNLLDKQSSDELKRLFLQMTQAESQVLASQSFKVSPELVEETRQRVLRVLAAIDAASGGSQ
ncbi:MAG TPA: DUF4350 domain-containing protein [Polyangiaceae bacterium]|nr:DUF4350 domain-containing protein [Polyangiaceae bacterium]